MRLTPEQYAVSRATGQRVRVTAYAGTGKTASLVAWAEAHPTLRTLYIAFNRSVKLQARQRFPAWVTTQTGHALAYATTGQRYADKLVADMTPRGLVEAQCFAHIPPSGQTAWAAVISETVQHFLASPDADIAAHHVPLSPDDWRGPYAWADPLQAVRDAQRVWRRMQDPQDLAVGMVHDGYLKQFVLDAPRLPFDAVLFDEAQDANPVLLQLLTQQTAARHLYVGDPWQAIYGWRGAVDAMQQIAADQDLALTASFRFGAEIARWATAILRWRDARLPPLQGFASDPGIVGGGSMSQPLTFLARSNARLFYEAVKAVTKGPPATLHWVGGIEGYGLDLLRDTVRLWQHEPVRSPFLQLFSDFEELKTYAETVEDVEWMGRCRAVEGWGKRLPGLIYRVQAASGPAAQAAVHLTTVHKAKGLEWPVVAILDDLAELTDDLSAEDQHLWYVAMTRATQQVVLPAAARERLAVRVS